MEHTRAEADFTAGLLDEFTKFPGDGMVIHDAFLRNVNGGDTGSVRFNFFDLLTREFAEAFQAIGVASFPKRFEARQFVRSGRDDDFAALLVGDIVLATKSKHLLEPPYG